MKRIVTAQDLTCLGKCALTVALPLISATGVECSVLPTALLSVHTAFSDFTFQDLSSAIAPVLDHWKREDFHFDAIYTGYLGGSAQIALITRLIDELRRPETLVFIDPAMGDNGTLYAGLSTDLPAQTAALCRRADVICPNLTEACLLLGRPYIGEQYSEADIHALLQDLCKLGAKQVILTGVSYTPERLGAVCLDGQTGKVYAHFHPREQGRFHGTGDTFASVCVACLVRGLPLRGALRLALDFTYESICCSLRDPARRWYSVNFEQAIPYLLEQLAKSEA